MDVLKKKMTAAAFSSAFFAAFLALSCLVAASPVLADPPEITPDTFAPGTSVGTLAPLKLQKQGDELQGEVAWDGYELAASVREAQGAVTSAVLRGDMNNGLIGMFMTMMSEKKMLPALMTKDADKVSLLRRAATEQGLDAEKIDEYVTEAMGDWAGDGQKEFRLLFLPEKVFQAAVAALRADGKTPLHEILAPHAKERAYGLVLTREGDRVAFHIGAPAEAGEDLKTWRE